MWSGLFSSAEPVGRSSRSSDSGSVRLTVGWGSSDSVGKHCVTRTETVCKDMVVLLKLLLKREFREIGLRAATNPVVTTDILSQPRDTPQPHLPPPNGPSSS